MLYNLGKAQREYTQSNIISNETKTGGFCPQAKKTLKEKEQARHEELICTKDLLLSN